MPQIVILLLVGLLLPSLSIAHGSHDERIAAHTDLIAAAPAEARLHLDRAAVHLDRKDWAAARADIDRAAQLDPDLATVHYLRGQLLSKRGWNARAEVALTRFLEKEPENPAGLAARARTRAALGKTAEAARDFSRAIAREQVARPDLYLERAKTLSDAGDAYLEEALGGLKRGIRKIGPLLTLVLAAVEIEVRMGRFDDATRRLDAATQDFPVRVPWRVRKGEILEAAGRSSAALQAYESALAEIAALPTQRQSVPAITRLRLRALANTARIGRK
ncbi:MAG: tetratricopeptide repeat protein [bacterium]|nr:tetratricopeptide repeat protein [bacterium]